jgi:hypothetical protein
MTVASSCAYFAEHMNKDNFLRTGRSRRPWLYTFSYYTWLYDRCMQTYNRHDHTITFHCRCGICICPSSCLYVGAPYSQCQSIDQALRAPVLSADWLEIYRDLARSSKQLSKSKWPATKWVGRRCNAQSFAVLVGRWMRLQSPSTSAWSATCASVKPGLARRRRVAVNAGK